jgi:hypothetical protein
MDCVLKNVGKQYVPEFQKNLHQTIPIVFKCSEEKDRQRIQRLIMTWKTFPKGNIFPMAVISKLEKELQAIVQKEKEPAPGPTAQSVQTQIEILIQKKKALNPILYPQVAGEIDVMNQVVLNNIVAACHKDY